jgi:hypothetical protein
MRFEYPELMGILSWPKKRKKRVQSSAWETAPLLQVRPMKRVNLRQFWEALVILAPYVRFRHARLVFFEGNEDNVTVSSFGNEMGSIQNLPESQPSHQGMLCSFSARFSILVNLDAPSEVSEQTERVAERRGSLTPSVARSEEADGAVIQGYCEPYAFRLLRRQNDQSSIQALEKALRDDPNLAPTRIRVDGAPSRRPTALGVPSMQ